MQKAAAWEEHKKTHLQETFIRPQFGIIMPVQKKFNNVQQANDPARDGKVQLCEPKWIS